MSAQDLSRLGQQRIVESPPAAAFFANDVGLAIITGGMIELRFRWHSESGNVRTVAQQTVVIPAGAIAEVLTANMPNILAAALGQMDRDGKALAGQMAALGFLPSGENGAPLSPEEMAQRRREAGG